MSLRRACSPAKRIQKWWQSSLCPKTYTEIWAFLGLVVHSRWFIKIKGFACIVQPLHVHLSWETAHKKGKWVMFMAEAKDAFGTFKRAWPETPMLAFADFVKPFLLESNASKLGLGAVLSQKQADCEYHLVKYASQSLTTHEHNYHSMKQEFLALRWVIAEQFQETSSGNHSLSGPTTIHSHTSWLHPNWTLPDTDG